MTMDLPVRLDRTNGHTLQQQLIEQLRRAILDGQIPAASRLPSTRTLAASLGVSRNVAVAAYDELFAEGYIEGRHGSGTYVAELPQLGSPVRPAPTGAPRWLRKSPPAFEDNRTSLPGAIDFRLGRPSLAPLRTDVWRRIWSEVANEAPPDDYGSPAGELQLRAAIAGYLGRARGVACGPDDMVITTGAIQAIDLLARAMLLEGDPVGVEEPGYPTVRGVLLGHRARIVPIPVDHDGLCVDQIPQDADAPLLVYTTPSHQYPLGARLSVTRRLMLLDWAQRNDALIIEDDYDSEFRFDAPPLPSLAALDEAGVVAYIGTFSKVLTPSLRVGYLVAPRPLLERVARLKRLTDFHTTWPVQRAMTAFITGGHLERHIRRMRRYYAEQRRILSEALIPVVELAQLRGLEAGLHAYLELREGLNPDQIAERARAHGVIVSTLDAYYHGRKPDRNGLLLGYGGLSPDDVAMGAGIIAEVIGAAEQRT